MCGNGAIGGSSGALRVAIGEGGEDASGGVTSTGTSTGIGVRETECVGESKGGERGREGRGGKGNASMDTRFTHLS